MKGQIMEEKKCSNCAHVEKRNPYGDRLRLTCAAPIPAWVTLGDDAMDHVVDTDARSCPSFVREGAPDAVREKAVEVMAIWDNKSGDVVKDFWPAMDALRAALEAKP